MLTIDEKRHLTKFKLKAGVQTDTQLREDTSLSTFGLEGIFKGNSSEKTILKLISHYDITLVEFYEMRAEK